MTNEKRYDKIYKSQICGTNGGIAQLARAIGSYPIGHGFKSSFRYHFGPLVKRLRHGPFTAVTWVRFPYGSPKNTAGKYPFLQYFLSKSQTWHIIAEGVFLCDLMIYNAYALMIFRNELRIIYTPSA